MPRKWCAGRLGTIGKMPAAGARKRGARGASDCVRKRSRFGRSASKLFEEYPHLKKRFWGRHLWARGYFCATVGQMTEEMIKQYLEHHFEPNPNDNFRAEPPGLDAS